MPCTCAVLSSVACPALKYFLINGTIFEKVTEHNVYVLIVFTTFVWNVSHSKKKWAKYGKQWFWSSCKVPLYSCPILMKLEFSRRIFEKSTNTKFHENPSSGSRVVPCGRKDMTKLIVTFRNFANVPKKYSNFSTSLQLKKLWPKNVKNEGTLITRILLKLAEFTYWLFCTYPFFISRILSSDSFPSH
jgi:hypothetical protein